MSRIHTTLVGILTVAVTVPLFGAPDGVGSHLAEMITVATRGDLRPGQGAIDVVPTRTHDRIPEQVSAEHLRLGRSYDWFGPAAISVDPGALQGAGTRTTFEDLTVEHLRFPNVAAAQAFATVGHGGAIVDVRQTDVVLITDHSIQDPADAAGVLQAAWEVHAPEHLETDSDLLLVAGNETGLALANNGALRDSSAFVNPASAHGLQARLPASLRNSLPHTISHVRQSRALVHYFAQSNDKDKPFVVEQIRNMEPGPTAVHVMVQGQDATEARLAGDYLRRLREALNDAQGRGEDRLARTFKGALMVKPANTQGGAGRVRSLF